MRFVGHGRTLEVGKLTVLQGGTPPTARRCAQLRPVLTAEQSAVHWPFVNRGNFWNRATGPHLSTSLFYFVPYRSSPVFMVLLSDSEDYD